MGQYYRRRFLQATVGVVGAGALAGCVGNDDGEQDTPTPTPTTTTPTPTPTPTPEPTPPQGEYAEEPEWSETDEAYLISTLGELNWIRNDREANYLLIDDIDASPTVNWNDGNGWKPIGTGDRAEGIFEFFKGSFDGQGYVIKDLFIDRGGEGLIGLFGLIDAGVVLTNVGVENVNVTGGKNYTGGLVGANGGGTISNSYATGSVSGYYWVGGLVAGNGTGGTIANSYSTVDVSATSDAGGLIGRQDEATVSNCYSTGDVTRTSGDKTSFGSFAGELDHLPGTIEYSYSTGNVYYEGHANPTDNGFVAATLELEEPPTYTSNFFDSDASNQSEGTGAEATTTAEMKDIDTFLDADWDIETTTEADPTDGYPFHSWQLGGSPTWYIYE